MTPVEFPEANCTFHAPPDLTDTQCGGLRALNTRVAGGSCDGAPLIVTAWQPTPEELAALNAGQPIFLSVLAAGLPPHFLTTDIHQATHPA